MQGPYHLTFRGFTGALPAVTSIILRLEDVVLWFRNEIFECLTNGPVDIGMNTAGGNPPTEAVIPAQPVSLTGAGNYRPFSRIILLD